jgi:hypothetical protein
MILTIPFWIFIGVGAQPVFAPVSIVKHPFSLESVCPPSACTPATLPGT